MKKCFKVITIILCLVLTMTLFACKKDKQQIEEPLKLTEGVVDSPVGRWDGSNRSTVNSTKPLVISTLTLDGKLNPFFATSQPDVDVVNYTQLNLITNSALAEPASGVNEPCLAYSHKMTVSEDKSKSTYEFVLKSGVQFSDGHVVNADDVLFNLYTYLDPLYDGSAVLYSFDIVGLKSYRTQIADAETAAAKVEELKTQSAQYVTDAYNFYTKAEGAPESIPQFVQDIIWNQVKTYTKSDLEALIKYEYTPADLYLTWPETYPANAIILGCYGGLDYVNNAWVFKPETGMTVENMNNYTADDYINGAYNYIKATSNPAEYDANFAWDCITGKKVVTPIILNQMTQDLLKESSGNVKSISGIKKGLKKCDDGLTRETITIELNKIDPAFIYQFLLQITPMHYYAGQTLHDQANGVDNFGVKFNDPTFMASLKEKNLLPMGAGPYKITDASGSANPTGNDFYSNGICYFTSNDLYIMSAPKIKNLRIKTVSSGSELSSVLTNEVHYSDPSATADILNSISAAQGDYAKLQSILVDNLGYGYIGINSHLIPNLNVRKALMSAMNTAATLEYYKGGLAEINYRSMSKVSWAYPIGCTAEYPFDESGETSKQYFISAGYTWDAADNRIEDANGNPLSYTFTLPSEANAHPAGAVFIKAKEVLNKIGVSVTINVDDGVLNKLEQDIVEVWAAAWQATIDPDLYQVYYSDPSANKSNSPKSYGLYWLFDNGTAEEKEILVELNQKIVEARTSLNPDERKPVYSRALDLIMDLAVELPTYQRKNMYVFNKNYIDASTLYNDVTPYRGPLYRIWEVSLLDTAQ